LQFTPSIESYQRQDEIIARGFVFLA